MTIQPTDRGGPERLRVTVEDVDRAIRLWERSYWARRSDPDWDPWTLQTERMRAVLIDYARRAAAR